MKWKELTGTEKVERVLASIVIAGCAILLIVMFTACKMDKPKWSDLPDSMTEVEKKITFKLYNCYYAQQFNKDKDLRCNDILNVTEKIDLILIFNELYKKGMLPKLYNQKGENEMTFDDYFKYVK